MIFVYLALLGCIWLQKVAPPFGGAFFVGEGLLSLSSVVAYAAVWEEQSPAPTRGYRYALRISGREGWPERAQGGQSRPPLRIGGYCPAGFGRSSASDTPRSMSGLWSQCPWGKPRPYGG